MPARRTAREERATRRHVDAEEPEAYEETGAEDSEDFEDDGQDREAYSGDETEEPDGKDPHERRARPRGSRRIPAAQAAQAGVRGLMDLIGKRPEGVTSVEPTEDGWLMGVEVIEDQRVPSSADVLAVYEAELDSGGDLLSYRRTARYSRAQGDQLRNS